MFAVVDDVRGRHEDIAERGNYADRRPKLRNVWLRSRPLAVCTVQATSKETNLPLTPWMTVRDLESKVSSITHQHQH